MKYVWSDYSKDFAKVVDSFLDEEAVKNTGCDEGFDIYYQYWIRLIKRREFEAIVTYCKNEQHIYLANLPQEHLAVWYDIILPP